MSNEFIELQSAVHKIITKDWVFSGLHSGVRIDTSPGDCPYLHAVTIPIPYTQKMYDWMDQRRFAASTVHAPVLDARKRTVFEDSEFRTDGRLGSTLTFHSTAEACAIGAEAIAEYLLLGARGDIARLFKEFPEMGEWDEEGAKWASEHLLRCL